MKTLYILANLLLWGGFVAFVIYSIHGDVRKGLTRWKEQLPTTSGEVVILAVTLFEIIGAVLALIS